MMDIYEGWFAGYTAEIRGRISGTFFTQTDTHINCSWNSMEHFDIPAVLDEVDLKIEHTYHVRDRCREIAQWLKLSDRDIELAATVGLLHDLGRFRQAMQFGTMDDRITGPHGEMSADVFLRDVPKENLSDEEITIIYESLHYHNVFKLPKTLTGKSLFFTQLVRDGDKLDIFRFYTDKQEKRGFRFIMSAEDGECSPDMLAGVLRAENLQVRSIRNKNDRKLMQVSLVYDMNFGYSFSWMLEKDYLAKITGVAEGIADEVMQEVYNYATNWMKQKEKVKQVSHI